LGFSLERGRFYYWKPKGKGKREKAWNKTSIYTAAGYPHTPGLETSEREGLSA
jgi:hypothetical protein